MALVSFHGSQGRTVRRYHLLRALTHLALHDADDDDTARHLVALAVDDHDWPHFAGVTAGHVVGALTADEAIRFAQLAEAFIADGNWTLAVEHDGRSRLHPAA
jgi:hypothetical protein